MGIRGGGERVYSAKLAASSPRAAQWLATFGSLTVPIKSPRASIVKFQDIGERECFQVAVRRLADDVIERVAADISRRFGHDIADVRDGLFYGEGLPILVDDIEVVPSFYRVEISHPDVADPIALTLPACAVDAAEVASLEIVRLPEEGVVPPGAVFEVIGPSEPDAYAAASSAAQHAIAMSLLSPQTAAKGPAPEEDDETFKARVAPRLRGIVEASRAADAHAYRWVPGPMPPQPVMTDGLMGGLIAGCLVEPKDEHEPSELTKPLLPLRNREGVSDTLVDRTLDEPIKPMFGAPGYMAPEQGPTFEPVRVATFIVDMAPERSARFLDGLISKAKQLAIDIATGWPLWVERYGKPIDHLVWGEGTVLLCDGERGVLVTLDASDDRPDVDVTLALADAYNHPEHVRGPCPECAAKLAQEEAPR